MTITVKARHPALGAEIRGVDMRQPLAADVVQAISDAWTKHLVMVMPVTPTVARSMRDDRLPDLVSPRGAGKWILAEKSP